MRMLWGVWGLRTLWVVLGLLFAHRAAADVILLSAKAKADLPRIEAVIRPAKVERSGSIAYVRVRVVDTHAAQPLGNYIVKFQPARVVGDKVVFGGVVTLEKADFDYTIDEVDSHLDLQLLLSSRDASNPAAPRAQRTRAAFGTPVWYRRMGRILNPDGPSEPQAETAALVHRGSVMFDLIEEPRPVHPRDAAGQAAYKRYTDAQRERQMKRISAGGVDRLHPSLNVRRAEDAVRALVEGAARARRYGLDDRDDPTFDKAALPERGKGGAARDLSERAAIAAAFLCTLRETPHVGPKQRCPYNEACVAEPALDPTGKRIADHASQVTTALRLMMEPPRAHHHPMSGSPTPLPLDPAEVSSMALQVVQRCRPFLAGEAEQHVETLLHAAADDAANPSAARRAYRTEAMAALRELLRPDLSKLVEPELTKRKDDAHAARKALGTQLFSTVPSERAAVLRVVVDGTKIHDVIEQDLVDGLFSYATGEITPEGNGTERQMTRREAVTMLMMIGTLADPKLRPPGQKHALAESILRRIRELREAKAKGLASRGAAEFLRVVAQRPGELEGDLRRYANRFAALLDPR